MKVIPIQGFNINSNIEVVVRAFTHSEVCSLYGIVPKEPNTMENMYIDKIKFVNKENLYLYAESEDVENIINKFQGISMFAIVDSKTNIHHELYDLKVALSMIYIAYRMKEESDYFQKRVGTNNQSDFFKGFTPNGYFVKSGGIQSIYWDVKIGTKLIDENDFYASMPVYYLGEKPDSWRIPEYRYQDLRISGDIQEQVNEISLTIIKNNVMSGKLISAMHELYHTLPSENMDVTIILYATILETLLLSKKEVGQREKVSVRAACLLQHQGKFQAKRYISTWIYQFYDFRNKIIHEGKSYGELIQENQVMDTWGVPLIKHVIFNIIKQIILQDITTVDQIKDMVEINKKQDELISAFDYIKEDGLNLVYEED